MKNVFPQDLLLFSLAITASVLSGCWDLFAPTERDWATSDEKQKAQQSFEIAIQKGQLRNENGSILGIEEGCKVTDIRANTYPEPRQVGGTEYGIFGGEASYILKCRWEGVSNNIFYRNCVCSVGYAYTRVGTGFWIWNVTNHGECQCDTKEVSK